MPNANVSLEDVLAQHGLDALRGLTLNEVKALTGAGERVARKLHALAAADTIEKTAPEADPAQGRTVDFAEEDDSYTFDWPSALRPLTLAGSTVRAIVRDYVRDGGNLTMRAVAAKHGLTRKEFHEIKIALDLTKDHEPFTDEELAARNVDDLVEETMVSKRRALLAKTERRGVREFEEGARKWAAFEAGTLDPFEAAVARALAKAPAPSAPPRPRPARAKDARRWMAHIHASDLHVGTAAWEGYGQPHADINTTRADVLEALDAVLDDMPRGGEPEFILAPVGGDWFHIDNIQGRTSSTRNAMDLAAIPEAVLDAGFDLAVDFIERLLEVAPVKIVCVPGNHDEMLSRALFRFLAARFAGDDVEVLGDLGPYQFVAYGENLLCLHHGHGNASAKALSPLVDAYAREHGIAARWRYAMTGNLHHVAEKDDAGVWLMQQPSLAPADRYHTLGGYTTAQRGLAAYGFDYARGHFWRGFAPGR